MWLWLNIPLAVLFVLAVSGIPLWMVIRHPDTAPDFSDARRLNEAHARAEAAAAAGSGQEDAAAWSERVAAEPESLQLAGSGRDSSRNTWIRGLRSAPTLLRRG